MLRITQLRLLPGHEETLEKMIRRTLRLREGESFSYEVLRRSIDARKKPELYETFTVQVRLDQPAAEKRILRSRLRNVEAFEPARYRYANVPETARDREASAPEAARDREAGTPETARREEKKGRARIPEPFNDPDRPVIIGTGPAGLFCGLLLARQGCRPILIERGQRATERAQTVRTFWDTGKLNPDSNVQFGEGGAGTFSDGKLNTGIKDPEGRIRFILETFIAAGADPGILSSAKPHVGTDVLKDVVANLTDEICMRGADVYFETRMEKVSRDTQGIWTVDCREEKTGEKMPRPLTFSTRYLVLAIGHSARETFSMLKECGIVMHPKAFAVGVRIQHPQSLIDSAMYGDNPPYALPASSYKLTHRLGGGRGVYSFCMCPGGYVVNASSEEGSLAVNGMSNHGRDSKTANSAIVVTVSPEEIVRSMASDREKRSKDDSKDPLIGIRFQRSLEKAAFLAGEGSIPVQRFGEFADHSRSSSLLLPDFQPGFCGKWKMAGIRRIFPEFICEGIEEGILSWGRQIKGFASPDALLCAAESRTSSPVRIERGDDLQAQGNPGLYPCGEGAGYAGGITSAAADGLKVAEQILKTLLA